MTHNDIAVTSHLDGCPEEAGEPGLAECVDHVLSLTVDINLAKHVESHALLGDEGADVRFASAFLLAELVAR